MNFTFINNEWNLIIILIRKNYRSMIFKIYRLIRYCIKDYFNIELIRLAYVKKNRFKFLSFSFFFLLIYLFIYLRKDRIITINLKNSWVNIFFSWKKMNSLNKIEHKVIRVNSWKIIGHVTSQDYDNDVNSQWQRMLDIDL